MDAEFAFKERLDFSWYVDLAGREAALEVQLVREIDIGLAAQKVAQVQARTLEVHVPVLIAIEPERLSVLGGGRVGSMDAVVEKLVARAKQLGAATVVFTFDPHPAVILRPEKVPPPLTSTARKAELLKRERKK